MRGFECVLQYPREELLRLGFPHRGRWNEDLFAVSRPIVLELGCGRGEYTVGLAQADPTRNFVGIDIKGARMWTGAKQVEESGMDNAKFLRCEIENLSQFYGPGEVDEIWITFPDPQMKKTRKRLTSTRFLKMYREMLGPDGIVNLKTDSPFLYEYTRRLVELNKLPVVAATSDLYVERGARGAGRVDVPDSDVPDSDEENDKLAKARAIQTYYEQQWLSRGKSIKLISFRLPEDVELQEPREDDIEKDDYRAIPRF